MKKIFIAFTGIIALVGVVHAGSECGMSQPKAKSDQAAVTTTKKAPAAQTKCPIMEGGAIDTTVFTIWKGDAKHSPKKVYFCCAGCINTFNQNPIKYIKKLEKMKQPIEDAPLVQPVQKPAPVPLSPQG